MNSRARTGWPLLATLGLLASVIAGCERPGAPTEPPSDPLPRLQLDLLDGGTLDSAEWAGRTVVLNIWATWCPPCREEMPTLQQLSQTLDPGSFRVIGLSLDSDRNLVREFALDHGITFPLAIDPDGHTIRSLVDVLVLPDTWIVAPDGRIADRVLGGADWASAAIVQRVWAARGTPSADAIKMAAAEPTAQLGTSSGANAPEARH